MCVKKKEVLDEKKVGNSGISISVDYNQSFRYDNKKGKWLVLKTIIENQTHVPQEAAYEFIGGKFCKDIMVEPTMVMGRRSLPLAPKTVNATVTNERFILEPYGTRQDVLIVSGFEESFDWRVGVADISFLIDKILIKKRTQLL